MPLMGGSADLGPSNKTVLNGFEEFGAKTRNGQNVRFGVREHAMGAIAGGLALHGGVIPYTGTFLIFSDYMRPPMRLAALMRQRVIYIFSHDSIALGEDGPTHQPIEQLMTLRAVPNLTVIRPADPAETAEAWKAAVCIDCGPTVIATTRQKVPIIDRNECAGAHQLHQGGYVLWESSDEMPEIILIGTGSETHLAWQAGKQIATEGIKVRVVSLPSWEIFERQSPEYRESVLPATVRKRVAVEAGLKQGWERYVGLDGAVIGMDGFGASAPYEVLYTKFGITKQSVIEAAKTLL